MNELVRAGIRTKMRAPIKITRLAGKIIEEDVWGTNVCGSLEMKNKIMVEVWQESGFDWCK